MASKMNPLPHGFLEKLRVLLSPGGVTTELEDLESYGKDWTNVFDPAPGAVVLPTSTEEVARVVKLCAEHEIPIVPSGGRTGLSGGAVAARGEVVINLSRMRQIGPIDFLAQTVNVQAGAVTQAVHEHCVPHGLTWPIDFASKGSSQVGGNISTNAGGVRVIRYGLTRNWVMGLRVVTADGQVLDLNGDLEKNQTGIDLRQLFIGSEGTLGIVTEATLKLTRLPGPSEVFFFALESIERVLKLFRDARSSSFVIQAFEVLGDNCLRAVETHRGTASPFAERSPYYVLLEVETPTSASGKTDLEGWLATLFDQNAVADGVLAQTSDEAKKLWELREGISESLSAGYLVHKHDISLPISKLDRFIADLNTHLTNTYRGHTLFLFGHIGDGNLHINLRKPENLTRGQFLEDCGKIDADLFRLVQQHGGSISAEHGIGLLKKHALHFSRTPAEIAAMRSIKRALDPKNLLNPGKILDL